MAITFTTADASKLLKAFKKAIDDHHVVTWSYDDENDFTHTAEQWKGKAWLRPKLVEGTLKMVILCPQGQAISSEVYAIYHGRFIESMLAHCDALFSNATASALPEIGDIVK